MALSFAQVIGVTMVGMTKTYFFQTSTTKIPGSGFTTTSRGSDHARAQDGLLGALVSGQIIIVAMDGISLFSLRRAFLSYTHTSVTLTHASKCLSF